MWKPAILIGVALAATMVAGDIITCKNTKNIPFEDMKQDTNVCHFLQEKVAGHSLASHDRIETCFCNLINKDSVWDGILNRPAKELYSNIVERLELFSNGYFHLKRRMLANKDEVLEVLQWGPKRKPKMKHFPAIKITRSCEWVTDAFSKYLHLFDNFDHFTGSDNIRLQLISRSPKLESLFVIYIVCKKLGH